MNDGRRIEQRIREMRADPHTVGEALTDLTADEYAATDRLVFEAIDGERTDGFQPEQLQAIGRHLVDSVIHQFDRIARKE